MVPTMLDSRRNVALACALSALAGYVDGIGFLHLGGLFVSFMSGNSTRLGVSLAQGRLVERGRGARPDRAVRDRRRRRQPDRARPRRQSPALGAAGGSVAARRSPRFAIPLACRTPRSRRSCWRWAWRMRCSRSRAAPASASLTSPGRWSRSANSLAAALTGGPRWAWLPNLLLWAALVTGVGVRRVGLSLDQSRRDLVCRRRGAGVERDGGRDDPIRAFLTCPDGR